MGRGENAPLRGKAHCVMMSPRRSGSPAAPSGRLHSVLPPGMGTAAVVSTQGLPKAVHPSSNRGNFTHQQAKRELGHLLECSVHTIDKILKAIPEHPRQRSAE